MPDSMGMHRLLQHCGVSDAGGFTHRRRNHSRLFADRKNHINGIENFYHQTKRILRKYNGADRKSFPMFLRESGLDLAPGR